MRYLRIPVTSALLFIHFVFFSTATGQISMPDEGADEEIYYVGINVVAPFTLIRSKFTTCYLPAASNLESGLALFVGKIWNKVYNVETRVSYGSPKKDYGQFIVQSGGMYCFKSKQKALNLYSGIFFKFEALTYQPTDDQYLSAVSYFAIGNRFKFKRWFLDLRLNENIVAISWANVPGHETKFGFHEPIYAWNSPYVPFGVINLGYFLK